MKKLIACIAMVACLTAGALAADDWKMVIRLQGYVASSVDNGASWQPIFGQRLLKQGDSAKTGPSGKARVQMPDGTVTMLNPETTITMTEIDKVGSRVKIRVERGGVRAKVGKTFSRGRFELDTRNGVLAAQGTDYAVWYAGDGDQAPVIAAVYEGTVTVGNLSLYPGDFAVLQADGEVLINPPGMGGAQVPAGLDAPSAPPPDPPLETSTYVQDTAPGSGAVVGGQQQQPLLPSSAGRIQAVSSPGGPTGTVEIQIRFRPGQP